MKIQPGPEQQARTLIVAFVLGGIFVVALAVALAIIVHPLYLAIALFSLLDFGLAWAYATGRMGPRSLRRKAEAAGDAGAAAATAAADPSYNPYARED